MIDNYSRQDVELALSYMFNGGRWMSETAPPPGARKAQSNPAQTGTDMAAKVDVHRAWRYALDSEALAYPEIVFHRLADQWEWSKIADLACCALETAQARYGRDIDQLVAFTNMGARSWATPDIRLPMARQKVPQPQAVAPFPWAEEPALEDGKLWGDPCPTCHISKPLTGICDCGEGAS